MQYVFILGREPAISCAELLAVLPKHTNKFNVEIFSTEFLLINTDVELNSEALMQALGGTIKIAKVFANIDQPITSFNFLNTASNTVLNFIKGNRNFEQKIFFGISSYGDEKTLTQLSKKLNKTLGLEIKKCLSVEGVNSRLVESRDTNLSAVTIKFNKLLSQRGLELLIIVSNNKIYLAETQAIQLFVEFGRRDYGRPGHDAVSGMLPPKLARIMLNLASVKTEATILDPFCGSGTVVIEALLSGHTNIYASDNSNKAVEDTQKNVLWAHDEFNVNTDDVIVINCDATHLSECCEENFIDAIITEPYLGPPLKGFEKDEQIDNNIQQLTELYTKSLQEFYKVLKPNGVVIMIWPAFGKNKLLPLVKKLETIGFKMQPLLPKEFSKHLTDRQTLMYSRSDQKVSREIVKLIKNPT